jgi:hypothetical protein
MIDSGKKELKSQQGAGDEDGCQKHLPEKWEYVTKGISELESYYPKWT